jgi:hypothetical protein
VLLQERGKETNKAATTFSRFSTQRRRKKEAGGQNQSEVTLREKKL